MAGVVDDSVTVGGCGVTNDDIDAAFDSIVYAESIFQKKGFEQVRSLWVHVVAWHGM
jgi:hypothetical protein